jgi:hypothetical protein
MLESEVPQDQNVTLGGHKKAVYARGADGRIHLVETSGWEVEEIVTRQAVDECDRRIALVTTKVLEGSASPLHYWMLKARMDERLLAQMTGLWLWQVKRHLRPDIFPTLSARLLTRYANALCVDVVQLKQID